MNKKEPSKKFMMISSQQKPLGVKIENYLVVLTLHHHYATLYLQLENSPHDTVAFYVIGAFLYGDSKDEVRPVQNNGQKLSILHYKGGNAIALMPELALV